MKRLASIAAAAALALAVPAAGEDITAPGPQGALAGTLIAPAEGKPVVLIVPGSGPTDRDGNSPLGVTAAPYRLLAEALATHGIGSLRIDKRGMFASKAAVPDANAATIAGYGDDLAAWVGQIRVKTGRRCAWLLGHSEGGLIALAAASRTAHLCGVIVVAAPGTTMGQILRAQLGANPANAPLMPDALAAIGALEKGQRVEVAGFHPALKDLFAPAIQGFLIDLLAHDPAALAGKVALPLLIVQGGKDLQLPVANGEALRAAAPAAHYVFIPAMNHVLKDVEGGTPQANMAAYADPSLPVSPALVDAVAAFVGGTREVGGARAIR